MYSKTAYVLIFVAVFVVLMMMRTLTSIFTAANESRMEGRRMKQLDSQAEKKRSGEDQQQIIDTLDKVTSPVINLVFPYYEPKGLRKIQRKLKVAGWDTYFTPIRWSAFSILLKIIGVVLLAVLWNLNKLMAGLWFAALFIGPNYLLNNSYNNRADELLLGFPEMIRIIAGYLSAGLIFKDAVLQSARNVKPVWQPLLEGLAAKCDTEGTAAALDWFKDEIDIMEAREFISIVRLNIELGNSAKSGFIEQADKIQELLRAAMQKKIEKRKLMATAIQAPLFLTIIGAFALPTVGSLIDIGLF